MRLCTIEEIPKDQLAAFWTSWWGSSKMVVSSGVYDCADLAGFAVLDDDAEIIGLITYDLRDGECEIISLNSTKEGKGIGTTLVSEVERVARENGCKLLRVTTTNDNLLALRFYQKRAFVLHRLICGAVDKARKIKPEIPLIGNDGIPIRDEIELAKILD